MLLKVVVLLLVCVCVCVCLYVPLLCIPGGQNKRAGGGGLQGRLLINNLDLQRSLVSATGSSNERPDADLTSLSSSYKLKSSNVKCNMQYTYRHKRFESRRSAIVQAAAHLTIIERLSKRQMHQYFKIPYLYPPFQMSCCLSEVSILIAFIFYLLL